MKSIPVLIYHHVASKNGFLSISKEIFEKQIEYLYKKGYYTLSAKEFFLFKQGKFNPPKNSVFLSFDDGWRDIYFFVYPILKEYGLKATMFLVTSWVEKASRKREDFYECNHKEAKQLVKTAPGKVILNWDEIEKMKDVFDLHSHTHTHFEEKICIKEEFEISKEILKKRLGIESKHLCWPRGYYNEMLLSIASSCGYQIFYTTKRGVNLPDNNMLEIKRIAVKPSVFWLKKSLFIYSSPILTKIYLTLRKKHS